jgi:hypothetical protein
MGCLIGAKYTKRATILHQVGDLVSLPGDEFPTGEFVENQDALTGEIVRVWQPNTIPDDPSTTGVNESTVEQVKCLARGVNFKSGINESFGADYKAMDTVHLWVPAGVAINRRDRVTNISTSTGTLLWTDEAVTATPKAMVFNVVGVTPVMDPFGKHLENYAVLERSEV